MFSPFSRVTRTVPLAAVFFVALGTASAARAQLTFSNLNPILIPDSGTANPYPSTITVANTTGTITGITVTLFGFTHTSTDDVAGLFTGPQNQSVLLFDGPGSSSASNLDLAFSDGAAAALPDSGAFTSGTYKPGQNEYGSVFAAPAPSGTYDTTFSSLVGRSANGTYNLYLQDFAAGDSGRVSGWSITLNGIQNGSGSATPEPPSWLLLVCCGAILPVLLSVNPPSHSVREGKRVGTAFTARSRA